MPLPPSLLLETPGRLIFSFTRRVIPHCVTILTPSNQTDLQAKICAPFYTLPSSWWPASSTSLQQQCQVRRPRLVNCSIHTFPFITSQALSSFIQADMSPQATMTSLRTDIILREGLDALLYKRCYSDDCSTNPCPKGQKCIVCGSAGHVPCP